MNTLQTLLDILNQANTNVSEIVIILDKKTRLKLFKSEDGKFSDEILSLDARYGEITSINIKYTFEVHVHSKKFSAIDLTEEENTETGDTE